MFCKKLVPLFLAVLAIVFLSGCNSITLPSGQQVENAVHSVVHVSNTPTVNISYTKGENSANVVVDIKYLKPHATYTLIVNSITKSIETDDKGAYSESKNDVVYDSSFTAEVKDGDKSLDSKTLKIVK